MPCVARPIVVTNLLLISAIAGPSTQQKDASLGKSTDTSVSATALFGSQCEGSYVSAHFVEKALGSLVSRECSGSTIGSTARVTWHLAVLSQTTETSYLRVVYELEHDVVFGRGPGCNVWKNSPINPQPLYWNSSNCGGFQEGSRRMDSLVEYLAELKDSELDEKCANAAFIKSSALSVGIGLEGELSIDAFVTLLRQRVEITRHGRQPSGSNPLLLARATTSETTSRSDDVESLVGSGFDEGDLVDEGSTTSSGMTWEKDFRQPPTFLHGIDRACTEGTYNTPMQAAQVTRGSSPGGTLHSWQLVENASQQGLTEENDPSQTYWAETEQQEEIPSDQGQMSDFEMHPGHKVWEWDKDRQQWKRRGRSGQEETDWFPESFA
ncbi:hypothetical protein NW754_016143 [Fusarium falciforme]|nr:hypothetical protein NW754_016143 [Fusarium falciforme]KAJ4205511.1 hypothetical protein NW767_003576 [Fusarium falciforme]